MMIIILLCCALAALWVLYITVLKSNKILFFDKYKQYNYPLVSAGSIEKNKKEANVCILGTDFYINKDKLDVKSYESYNKMIVDGNSMKEFGIQSGDIVIVDENDSDMKPNSIIVFNIQPEGQNRIEYKLRKFIDFYDFEKDFQTWIKNNHPDLDVKKLMNKYNEQKTQEKIKECNKNHSRLVLSETRGQDKWYQIKSPVYYSLHPENCIKGKVRYRVPREKVHIMNKV